MILVFLIVIFLRAWILGTIPGAALAGVKETSRDNKKREGGDLLFGWR